MAENDGSAPATGGAATTGETPKDQPATGTGTPATGATGSTPTGLPTQEEWAATQESIRKMEHALKEANKESEKRRKELSEAEKAKLTAEEQTEAELKELRAAKEEWDVQRAELFLEREVNRLAPTLGIVDAEVITRLLDWDELEFDDKGRATNVETAVKAILGAKPYLSKKPEPVPGGTRTGNNAADGTSGDGPAPNLTAAELEAAKSSGIDPVRYAALKNVKTIDDWNKTRRTGSQ